jgi:hypothetical protein
VITTQILGTMEQLAMLLEETHSQQTLELQRGPTNKVIGKLRRYFFTPGLLMLSKLKLLKHHSKQHTA